MREGEGEMRRPRITDTARLDWLADKKAEAQYIVGKVGPGWIREAGWRVFVKDVVSGKGKTLREAIDAAMSTTEPGAKGA